MLRRRSLTEMNMDFRFQHVDQAFTVRNSQKVSGMLVDASNAVLPHLNCSPHIDATTTSSTSNLRAGSILIHRN
jgi:hypothetical protein